MASLRRMLPSLAQAAGAAANAGNAGLLSLRGAAAGAVRAMSAPTVYEKMVHLTAVDPDGHRHSIKGLIGRTLAETLKSSPELHAQPYYCQSPEGHWDCHVKIAHEWIGKLPELSEANRDSLKEHALEVSEASRMGTQITLNHELDNMVVAISPLHPWRTL